MIAIAIGDASLSEALVDTIDEITTQDQMYLTGRYICRTRINGGFKDIASAWQRLLTRTGFVDPNRVIAVLAQKKELAMDEPWR